MFGYGIVLRTREIYTNIFIKNYYNDINQKIRHDPKIYIKRWKCTRN